MTGDRRYGLARRGGEQHISGMAADISAPFLRLFIALAIPDEVRVAIGRAQSRLRRESAPGAVRWTPADQFHITLKFLGDVPAEQLAAVQAALEPVCAGSPALALSVRGIGFFPHFRAPRIMWAGAQDERREMPELASRIDKALRWLEPSAPPEKFVAHVTLGRIKPGHHAAIPRLVEMAEGFRDRSFGEWLTREVELVRSELTPLRATHTVVGRFALNVI